MKNKMLFNIGINNCNYRVYPTVNGIRVVCQYYRAWAAMLARCYHKKTQVKQPVYKDCTVCDEWHYFMTFRAWMIEQNWEGNHLDKDIILPGNKVYSPSTCCFVSHSINQLLTNNKARRGKYPQGVHFNQKAGKYHSAIRIDSKKIFLGVFDTPEDASIAYCNEKYKNIVKIAKTQQEPIRSGLLRHAELFNQNEEIEK